MGELPQELVLAVGSGLCGAIIYLFKLVISHHKKTEKAAVRSQEAHAKCQESVMRLTGEVGELKGRMQAVSELSESVLKKLTERIGDQSDPPRGTGDSTDDPRD